MSDRYWCAKHMEREFFFADTLSYYRTDAIKEFDELWVPGVGKSMRRNHKVKVVRVEILEVPKESEK